MALPKGAALVVIILIAIPIIGFVLRESTTAPSPTSIAPYTTEISPTETPGNAGIANPASVYCQEQGGKSEIITSPDGSQVGQCVFSDGRKCDEWQFFRTKACN